MSYFFGSLNRRAWGVAAAAAAGGAAVVFCPVDAWGLLRRGRRTVPLFDTQSVVRAEEHVRYPCQAFDGYSVVVWNYYVRASANDASGDLRDDGNTSSSGSDDSSTLSGMFSRLCALFSNETHTVVGRINPSAEENQLHLVREVVGDARAPPLADASTGAGSTTAAAATDSVPFVACSTWPAGTAKYSAMTIEPSSSSPSSSALDELRRLADGATHQSLIRCDPFAPSSLNCAGDSTYLGAPYLRVMLSAFLLLPSPLPRLRVAVLGVGGGSLPAFLQQYFSRDMVRLDLVDAEPQCFRAAVRDLGMRETMRGAAVVCHARDAAAFLRDVAARPSGTPVVFGGGVARPPSPVETEQQHARRYDVMFVDLFVGSEAPSFVSSPAFLQLCRGALSPVGVAAFNLPAADAVFVERCRAIFGRGNVFSFPVPASANVVVLARQASSSDDDDAVHVSHRHFYRRAQALQKSHALPYDLSGHYPFWWCLW